MIIKGKLKIISGGVGQRGGSHYKYDFVEIGEYTIRNVTIDNYLYDRLDSLFNQDIELSIMKRFFIFPKTIAAIRTNNGQVYHNQDHKKRASGSNLWGGLMLSAILFIYMLIPYGFVFGVFGALLHAIGFHEGIASILSVIVAIIIHYLFTRKCYRHLVGATNAFGHDNAQNKMI